MKYRVTVDAFRLGHDSIPDWFMDKVSANAITLHNSDGRWRGGPDWALIYSPHGIVKASYGDFIVRGVKGDITKCDPDTFAKEDEAVS